MKVPLPIFFRVPVFYPVQFGLNLDTIGFGTGISSIQSTWLRCVPVSASYQPSSTKSRYDSFRYWHQSNFHQLGCVRFIFDQSNFMKNPLRFVPVPAQFNQTPLREFRYLISPIQSNLAIVFFCLLFSRHISVQFGRIPLRFVPLLGLPGFLGVLFCGLFHGLFPLRRARIP